MTTIRAITETDSDAFAELIIRLAEESDFTLLTPAEAQTAALTQAERTRMLTTTPTQAVFLAIEADNVVGFIALSQGTLEKNTHACSLMMGVLASFQNRGLGSLLLEKGLSWAVSRGIKRVELGVMTENDKAIRLYRKFGFAIEGTRINAIMLNQRPKDEHIMARYI